MPNLSDTLLSSADETINHLLSAPIELVLSLMHIAEAVGIDQSKQSNC